MTTKPITPADAIAVGQTLRSFAERGYPNPETAAVMGRVGEWLLEAGQTGKAGLEAPEPPPIGERASRLRELAVADARGEGVDAIIALTTALMSAVLDGPHPRVMMHVVHDTIVQAERTFLPAGPQRGAQA